MRGSDLALRIASPATDRHVTRWADGLTFRKVANGGCADLQTTLYLPRSTFPDLGPDAKVYLYDRTGRTIWEGFANNPGHDAGPGGESFDLSAEGIMTLVTDNAQPVVYRDTGLGEWVQHTGGQTVKAGTGQVGTLPDPSASDDDDPPPALVTAMTPGVGAVATNGRAGMLYEMPAGQLVAAISADVVSGIDSTDWRTDIVLTAGTSDHPFAADASTTPATTGVLQLGTDWTVESGRVFVFLIRTGAATNIATDDVWTAWTNVAVAGSRLLADGSEAPAGLGLFAYNVVEDCCGRFLAGLLDPNRVSVTPFAGLYEIDQLAYRDAVKMQQILDDLALFEPDMTWEVTPSAGGLYGFTYREWGDEARYEISTRDGFNQPGSDGDLCNRVAVSWTDATGKQQTTVVTSSVPELGSRVRDADPVSLPDGQGSEANATKLGQTVLAAASSVPVAGTAVVKRRILDRQTGRMVPPWEIEPGWLVRVRETGQDLRLTEMTYAHDDRAATLTLGDPVYTTEQYVAALASGRRLIPLNSGGTYTAA